MGVTRKVALGALAVAATATGIWVLSDYRAWAALTGGSWRDWLAARTRRPGATPGDAGDEAPASDTPAPSASETPGDVAAQHGSP